MENKIPLYGAKADFKEAKLLADYTSIYQDLGLVAEVLKRLKQLLENDSKDLVLQESYWTTSLIIYCRCFAKGKRLGLSENIYKNNKLKGDPIGCHRYYKNQRDKLIAHSVNPFEQVAIELILSNPDSRERKVEGTAILAQKLFSLQAQDIKSFLGLALFARQFVAKQSEEYRAKTLEAGKKLPMEFLYSMRKAILVTPSPEEAGKAREE